MDIPNQLNALSAVNAVATVDCALFGDLNCDGTIDAADFRHMLHCVHGPNGQASVGFCSCGNYPQRRDDIVDMADFAQFQLAFTGYGSGACCHKEGYCTIEPVNVCAEEFGATYQGHDTTCEGVECPLIGAGACCWAATTTCDETWNEQCTWSGGFYFGEGVRCAATTCPTARYHNIAGSLSWYVPSGPGLQLADDITLEPVEPPADAALGYYELAVYGGDGGNFDVTVGLYTDCPGMGGELIPGTEYTFTDNPDNGSPVFLSARFDGRTVLPDRFWMVATFSTPEAGWFPAGQTDADIGWTEDVFGRYDLGEPPEEPHWVCNYWWGGDPYAGLWANIGCVEPVGACCQADFSCTEGTLAECAAADGYYQGYGTECASVDCSTTQNGACCSYDDGICRQTSREFCESKGYRYEGDGTTCDGRTCPWGRYRNEIDEPHLYQPQFDWQGLADDMFLEGTGARELVYYNLLVYGGKAGVFTVTASLYTTCPGYGGTEIVGTAMQWTDIPDDGYPHLLEADLSGLPVTIPSSVWMVVTFSTNLSGWFLAGLPEVGWATTYFGGRDPNSVWWCDCHYSAPYFGGFWANLRCEAAGGLRSGAAPVLTITPVPLAEAAVPVSYQALSSAGGMSPGGTESVGKPEGEDSPQGWERERILVPARSPAGGTPIAQSQERRWDARPACLLRCGPWSGPEQHATGESRSQPTVMLALTSPSAGQTVQTGEIIQWSLTATVSQGDNAGLALLVVDLVQDTKNAQLFDLPQAEELGPDMVQFDRPYGIANPAPPGGLSGYLGTPVGPEGTRNLAQIGGALNTFGEPGDTMGLSISVYPYMGQSGPLVIATGSFPAPERVGKYTFRLENGIANVLYVAEPPPAPPDFWPVRAAKIAFGSQSFRVTVCAEIEELPLPPQP